MDRKYPTHIVAAGAFVTNAQGQVLMIKSPRYGDWEFPGGQVEESETIPHALEREVFEETGIVVRLKSLVGIYSNTRKPSILNLDFACEYISGEPTPSVESSQVEWVDREEALNRVQRQAIHGRLKNMLEFNGEITYPPTLSIQIVSILIINSLKIEKSETDVNPIHVSYLLERAV